MADGEALGALSPPRRRPVTAGFSRPAIGTVPAFRLAHGDLLSLWLRLMVDYRVSPEYTTAMDTKSTPSDLISPEAARLIWADLLPDPPETDTALLRRTERGTGPPCHLVDGPGTGRRMYNGAEVRAWCMERQSPAARRALPVAALLDYVVGTAWRPVAFSFQGGQVKVEVPGKGRRRPPSVHFGETLEDAAEQALDAFVRPGAAGGDA